MEETNGVTKKQLDKLYAVSIETQQPTNYKNWVNLSRSEASAEIDRLENLKQQPATSQPELRLNRPGQISQEQGYNFGMAAKGVQQYYLNKEDTRPPADQAISLILHWTQLFESAKKRLTRG